MHTHERQVPSDPSEFCGPHETLRAWLRAPAADACADARVEASLLERCASASALAWSSDAAAPDVANARLDTQRALYELNRRRFFCDHRPGVGIRIAPHFYTTDEELEHTMSEIRAIVGAGVAA